VRHLVNVVDDIGGTVATRFDLQVSDAEGRRIRQEAANLGQSHNEFIKRRVMVGREAGPYPFTGPINGPSFIRDLASVQGWSTGEAVEIDEAFDRLRKFEKWSEDNPLAFTTQTTTTASTIFPTGYKTPVNIAMNTDRPLAAACEVVEINSSNPFNVPRATGDNTVHPGRAEGAAPAGSDPVFGTTAVVPVGLAGKIDLTRELVDGASPGGDLIALSVMREDFERQVEIKIYNAFNTAQSGTITGDFVPLGTQVTNDATPTTTLHTTLKKCLLKYAVLRRRKPRNVILGRAAIDNLASLLLAEDTTGDDTCLARIYGARVNASTNDFAVTSTDMRIAILGSEDCVLFESPLAQFRFDEQSGPALVTAAVWGYHAVVVARPVGLSSIRF
jgi:hypothetical protein